MKKGLQTYALGKISIGKRIFQQEFRKILSPLIKFAQWSVSSISTILYLCKVKTTHFTVGIAFRWKTQSFRNKLAAILPIVGFVGTMFALLGYTIFDALKLSLILKPCMDEFVSFCTQTSEVFLDVIIMLISSAFLYILIKNITSKERLFIIATKRLSDNIPQTSRATRDNKEAEELIRLIASGRRNWLTYEFLTKLWSIYIKSNPTLSLLHISNTTIGRKERPIVIVDVSHLQCEPEYPEKQLNKLLKVDQMSIYKDYSGVEKENSRIRYCNEKLLLRKPVARYLSRYKGPTEKEVGFRDDYTGYNACLKSMNFKEGKLELPIECTLELYGNIMDSSDALINELYLHHAFDRYSSKISSEVTLSLLPWRKKLHRAYDDPIDILTQVRGRAAAFGISALTVFNRDGIFVAARGTRTTKVADFSVS